MDVFDGDKEHELGKRIAGQRHSAHVLKVSAFASLSVLSACTEVLFRAKRLVQCKVCQVVSGRVCSQAHALGGFACLSACVQVNGGFEPDADVGPLITPEAKKRCEELIQAGIDQVRLGRGSGFRVPSRGVESQEPCLTP